MTEVRDDRQRDGGELLSLGDLVRFVRKYGALVVALAGLAGLVTFLAVYFLVPRRYAATATLVLGQNAQPELAARNLRKLLESGAVLDETVDRLGDRGKLPEHTRLTLGRNLTSEMIPTTPGVAAMIEARATAENPALAASMANTWARVFLKHARIEAQKLLASSGEPVTQALGERTKALQQSEQSWEEAVFDYRDRLLEAQVHWDEREAAYRKETAQLLAVHRVETREGLASLVQEAEARESDAAVAWTPRIRRLLAELLVLRQQIAQRSEVVTLVNAVGSDTLWEALSATSPDPNQTPPSLALDRPVLTQALDPAVSELTLRATRVEAELRGEAGDRPAVLELIESLQETQDHRSAELAQLHEERQLGLAKLARQRVHEIHQIQKAWSLESNIHNRRLKQERNLVNKLTQQQQGLDVQEVEAKRDPVSLLAEASPSAQAAPRHTLLKAAAAAVLAGLLGIVIGVLREFGTEPAVRPQR